jgi:cysteinyl-tRNA synthetase
MIRLIEALIKSGHAYEKNGNVFLDVTTFPGYGRLSGNTLENLKVGARLEEHPDKRHPWDFALWLKAPKEHLMHWPSPWSEGYPGWHIECSAMSMEYLGDTLDIHTGGEDNIFPHHEAEIVQSEGVTGKPFVRYFLHTRHILVNGEKMSKSKGNFYTLENILERGFSPMDLRMLFIGAHYRSQMNFTWEALEQAKKNKEALFGAIARLEAMPASQNRSGAFDGASYLERFRETLADDLNTPEALSIALECAKQTNTLLDEGAPIDREALETSFGKICLLFGLVREKETVSADIDELAKKREAARI